MFARGVCGDRRTVLVDLECTARNRHAAAAAAGDVPADRPRVLSNPDRRIANETAGSRVFFLFVEDSAGVAIGLVRSVGALAGVEFDQRAVDLAVGPTEADSRVVVVSIHAPQDLNRAGCGRRVDCMRVVFFYVAIFEPDRPAALGADPRRRPGRPPGLVVVRIGRKGAAVSGPHPPAHADAPLAFDT
jgi:hypothetical protein